MDSVGGKILFTDGEAGNDYGSVLDAVNNIIEYSYSIRNNTASIAYMLLLQNLLVKRNLIFLWFYILIRSNL